MSTPTSAPQAPQPAASTGASDPHAKPVAGRPPGLGELGRTTSSRAWLILVALALVIVGFAIWGLFGTIPVQSTLQGQVTNGDFPIQIASPVDGTVLEVLNPLSISNSAASVKAAEATGVSKGARLMTLKPSDGSAPVEVTAPQDMYVTFDVVTGSPVTTETVVAHGIPVFEGSEATTTGRAYAFLSMDEVDAVQTAESLSVTPDTRGNEDNSYAIKVSFVGTVPDSQDQIALLTNSNTLYAQQAFDAAQGAAYVVVFDFIDAPAPGVIDGNYPAQITVTTATAHPLQILFGN